VSLLADTARRLDGLGFSAPAVVVDERRARANIAAMAAKAAVSGVRLRPHFKTHDNVGVGRWFREAGVRHATVSSLAMAERFARDGWRDLTLAILVSIDTLATSDTATRAMATAPVVQAAAQG